MDGKDGVDGKTPVKGEDYFTEQEKQDFIDDITEEITPTIKDKVEEIIGDVDLDGNASSIEYDSSMAVTHDVYNVKDALDKLLNKVYWTKLVLNSFTISPSNTTYEVGDTKDITLTWSWNKTPTKETINDKVESSGYTETINSNSVTTKTFSLKGYDNDAENNEYSVPGSKSIYFKYKIFITDSDISDLTNLNNIKHKVWCDNGEQNIGDGSTEILKGKIISFCLPTNKNITVTNVNTGEKLNLVQKSINNSNTITYDHGTASTSYKIMQAINVSELSTTQIKIKIS